jgi:hypothetical protein
VTIRTEEAYYSFDLGGLELEVVVRAHVYPSEPMVRYYRNGDGYPGAPSYAEILSVWVIAVHGEFGSRKRNQGDDWFKDLDRLASDHVEKNHEEFENMVLRSIECEDY